VPGVATLPLHPERREIPAASCSPLGSGAGIVMAEMGVLEGVKNLLRCRNMKCWLMSGMGRLCCKSRFALVIKNSAGCRRDLRVKI
jgi:hypothetical protein